MASRFKLGSTHKDKERVKVNFDIAIKTAENVPTTGNVYVQWKRGKKNENKGESKHVAVKDKKAVFEQVVEISATLYKIPKKGYESKNISITLKEEKGKKGNSIAKTVIDLAEFAGKDEKRSFSLKSKKSKVAPTLTLHFKSKERELAPDEDVTETDNVTEETNSDDEDDVEDFTDDSKDDGSSKSNKSTPASAKVDVKSTTPSTPDKSRDLRRDSVSSLGSLDVDQLRAELEKAKKRTKELATENVDFEDRIKLLEKELEDSKKAKSSPGPMNSEKEAELRKKIKDLTKENEDKDELIKNQKKELEEVRALSASGGMSSEKEDKMKKRLKELATENVDLEEEVNKLKKEMDELKSQGGKKADKDDGSAKQVQELNERIREKDGTILSQKQELETLKKSLDVMKEKDGTILSQKQELDNLKKSLDVLKEKDETILSQKQEIDALKKSSHIRQTEKDLNKERDTILTQKQELERLVKEKDSSIQLLNQEIQSIKKSSESTLADKEELRKKIKELTRANEDTEEEVEGLKKQVEQLKKSSVSAVANVQADDTKKLQNELRAKDDTISDLESEIERLKRKSNADSPSVQDYKDKVDNYKLKIRELEEENDQKLESARAIEQELRDRIRELEDSNDSSKMKSSASRDRQDKDRERYEREAEKEKDARKKAEKEVKDLREKVQELERSQGNGRHVPNGKDDSRLYSLEQELEREKKITAAVYSHTGHYSSEEGVSEAALAVWAVMTDENVYRDPDNSDSRAVADRIVDVLRGACNCTPNDMNLLFYWLSTTSALLHMLRDESDAQSNNDRDPIIDGVYQPAKEPSSGGDLQDHLEWLCFSVYKQLVSVICTKLTPVLAPVIIEKPLTDKKTQVRTSAVMRILDRVLARTRHHYLYDAVVQQLFVQIFYFISCHLVNTILQKPKLTPSIGFQIKLGLSHLEDWISQPSGSSAERALLAPCQSQLDSLRDVGGVLVLDKSLLADSSTLQSIFRALNLKQIKQLLEVFEPDQLAQDGLPSNVRAAVATMWNSPQASSLPLLLNHSKMLAFSPQLD